MLLTIRCFCCVHALWFSACPRSLRMKKKVGDHRPRNSAQYEQVVELWWGLCALRHGIQNPMPMGAILTCHPAQSTKWLDWVAKRCELWHIRTGFIHEYKAKKSFLTKITSWPFVKFNGACAHYVMLSKFQWKPFWLATHGQRDPQNDWTATQNRVNSYVFVQAPFQTNLLARTVTKKSASRRWQKWGVFICLFFFIIGKPNRPIMA